MIYQKAPFCFFSLNPGANVTTLKDFEGLKVGSNSGVLRVGSSMVRALGILGTCHFILAASAPGG